jgi:hypothetical protein
LLIFSGVKEKKWPDLFRFGQKSSGGGIPLEQQRDVVPIKARDSVPPLRIQLLSKIKNPRQAGDFSFFVAGERHATSGKIHMSVFPAEISALDWETSSFSYYKKNSRPIRLIEPSASELLSPEAKALLSGISLITEIVLQ